MNLKEKSLLPKCFREKHMRIAIGLVVCLLFFITFFTQSYQATRDLQRKNIYGCHNGCAFDITQVAISSLKEHQAIQEYGEMAIYGSILRENGVSAGYIGTIDEDFCSMEGLAFLEGSYPEEANEIAIEYAVLDLLGIAYQLGEEITFPIQLENGTVIEQTYYLCGILKSYTTNWKNEDYALCSAIVAEFAGTALQRHLFFLGDYENEEQMKELEQIVLVSEKSALVYNDYSYPEQYTSMTQTVEHGVIILAAAIFCVLFLACMQISSYRAQAYRIRVLTLLGAERKELIKILFRQAFGQWVECALVCLMICSSVSAILILFVPETSVQFVLTAAPYTISTVVSLVTALIGKAVQVALLKKVLLLPKGRDLTRYEIKKFTKRDMSKPFNEKNFCKIQRGRNRKCFCIEYSLLVLSVLTLFICLYGICSEYKDYSMFATISGEDYSWTSTSAKVGLKKDQISQLKNTANIDKVIYSSIVNKNASGRIYIAYEGFETDPYRIAIEGKKNQIDQTAGMAIYVSVIPEDSVVWDYYIPDEIDKQAFLRGESVITFFPGIALTENGYYQYVNTVGQTSRSDYSSETYFPNVHVGDQMKLVVRNEQNGQDKEFEVQCAYLMYQFPSEIQTAMDFITIGTVLVSESLYMQMFEMDEPCYNYVVAFGNSELSYEAGDKIASEIAQNKGILFENHRLEKEERLNLLKTDILALGLIAVFACSLALIIIYRNRLFLFEVEHERLRLLRRLGCENSVLETIYKRRVGTFLSLVLIGLCITVILIIEFCNSYFKNLRSIADRISLFFSFDLYKFPILVLIIPPLLYWVIYLTLFRKAFIQGINLE